ncbi:MAG: ATP-binding cassette domain-containing protein [Acidimicrobiia bacterium]|nr:ATP-binding cassette domain-containing protein [Acidimicrobiia bacterium]
MTAAEDVVELDGVAVKRGGHRLWSEGTFALPAGACVAVIGPNGSGKTTLFELLLGLVAPSEGSVRVLGDRPRRGNRRIGYVPQNYTASVGEAVRCRDLVALGISGTRWGMRPLSANDRGRVDAALEDAGVAEFANRRVSRLSGGQQQRVAIAQALVDDPDLLLLDEPLSSLDVASQSDVVSLIEDVSARGDVTIMVVSHDVNPLLPVLTGAVYLLDGHPHYDEIGAVVNSELLTHLYGTPVRVVRTAQGDLFTRGGGG